MNTSLLQRLTYLTLLPVCTLIVITAAHAAEPAATPDAPTAIAPAQIAPVPADEARKRPADGQGSELVNIGHDTNLPRGQKADSVVSIFGSSSSDGEAGTVVSILGDTRIGGAVTDSAVTVLGNMYVDSKVDGDAVAVLGSLELGPHAQIGGNVVVVGGGLQRNPAAIVHGGVENVFAGNFGSLSGLHTWIHQCLLYGRPLALVPGIDWAWGLALACLALYVFLALLFRESLFRCVETFETQPRKSVLAALLAMLLTPVLVVLLCVTVIGIAAVPFVMFGLFCACLFGKAVMLAWLGWRVTGRQAVGPLSHPAVAVLIGGVIVLVSYVVPLLGFLAYQLLGLLGLGAVVYTAVLAARAHQAAKAAPGSSTAPGTAASPGLTPMTGVPPETRAASMSAATPPTGDTASGAAARPATQAPESSIEGPSAYGPAPDATPRGPDPRSPAPAAPAPPITAALPRAGFWVRMAALLLDGLLVGFVMGMLHHAYHLELLALASYGAVMWKTRGSTIGGIVFDLHVVRLDGRKIEWETAIVRALSCFLSLAVAGLGFIWIAFDHNNQAWHDKIAGTVVVRVAKGVPLL